VADHDYCQVVTTAESREAAEALSRAAVQARLAACGQVSGPVTSTYWWDGQIETAQEWRVTFKTTTACYPALEQHIRSRHRYDVPEILCSPVTAGSPDYLAWISAQTRPVPDNGAPST
jgi:periplasmic divalent cation tolerance protein